MNKRYKLTSTCLTYVLLFNCKTTIIIHVCHVQYAVQFTWFNEY